MVTGRLVDGGGRMPKARFGVVTYDVLLITILIVLIVCHYCCCYYPW